MKYCNLKKKLAHLKPIRDISTRALEYQKRYLKVPLFLSSNFSFKNTQTAYYMVQGVRRANLHYI